MADENRTPPHPLTLLEQLHDTAYAFDFYQALRRLDCSYPDKPPTGQSSRAIDDPVRIGQEASMAFAPATLYALESREELPPRLIQRFFGMLGPQGPMPLHITDYIRDRLRNNDDETLLRFLDVFHHRMITLFYRAWARVRPTVSFDQPAWDRFSDYTGSLFGLGMRTLVNRDSMPDLPKRHFSGLMSCQTRHAEGLLAILKGFFRLPVQVDEFVGQWVELPANCRCLLGLSSAKLGVNTTVGSHIWDCQQKFRVILGPLTLEEYYRMLPGRSQLTEHELDEPIAEPGSVVEPSENGQPTADASLFNGEPNALDAPGLGGNLPQSMDDQSPAQPRDDQSPAQPRDDQSPAQPRDDQSPAQPRDDQSPAQPRDGQSPAQPRDGKSPAQLGDGHSPEGGLPLQEELAQEEQGFDVYEFDEQAFDEVLDELTLDSYGFGDEKPRGRAFSSTSRPTSLAHRPHAPATDQAATATAPQRPRAAARNTPPRGISLDRMIAAVRAYVGDELQWDLQLILQKDDTPPVGLGIVGNLGWSSWVIRDNMPYDPNDLVLDAMGTPAEKQLIEFRHVRAWNHKTLGQQRNGQYIVATIDTGDLSVVQALST